MRGFLCLLYSILCSLTACHISSSFDQQAWIDNPEMSDTSNPRAGMVEDLMRNHLKPGMSHDAVMKLLGKPYKDGVEQRLPKGINLPDCLSRNTINSAELSKQNSQQAADLLNQFYRSHSQPDTLMLYPVGWSTIDPNFLVIKLAGNDMVSEYWVEQH